MGVCGLLIGGGIILASSGCCDKNSINTDEGIRDINYSSLEKQENKKDGLDIYKANKFFYSSKDVKCPLCKFSLSKEENSVIDNILQNGYLKFVSICKKYGNLVENPYKIYIFEELESIYSELEEPRKNIEENRYYYHICKRNNICNRTSDKAIYIDLINKKEGYDFDLFLEYDHKKLRKDPEYKEKIIMERTERYHRKMNEIRIREIESEYRPEFEDYCCQKEDSRIYQAKITVKFSYDFRAKPGDIGYDPDPFNLANHLWIISNNYVYYSGSKNKILEYIIELTGETPFKITGIKRIGMSDNEYEEFQEYIKQRDSEYRELILNS